MYEVFSHPAFKRLQDRLRNEASHDATRMMMELYMGLDDDMSDLEKLGHVRNVIETPRLRERMVQQFLSRDNLVTDRQ